MAIPRMEWGLVALALAAPVSKTLSDVSLFATGLLFLWDWREGRARPRRTPLDGVFLLWVAAQLLSTVVSVDPLESVRDLRNLGYGAIFYLAVWGIAAGARLERLIACSLAAGAAAAMQGVAEVTIGFDLLHEAGPTASGFFTGHLPFAHSQAMLFVLALSLLRESGVRKVQIAYAALAVTFASAVIASGGRGPWLALAVTVVVLNLRAAPRRIVLALALVAVIQLAFVARRPGGLESFYRSYVVVDDAEVGEVRDATVYSNLWRLTMWREGLRIFSLRPVLGTGAESTGALSREFRTPFVDFGVSHLHSNYLELAMTRGLAGLAAFFAVGLALARVSREGITRLPAGRERAVAVTALGVVLLHAVHGLTYYSLGSTPLMTGTYLLLGLGVGVARRDLVPPPEPPLRWDAGSTAVGLGMLALVVVVWPFLENVPRVAVGAAVIALADAVRLAVAGRLGLLEAAFAIAFGIVLLAAVILLLPLPNGLAVTAPVVVAAAAVFVPGWAGLRIGGASREALLKQRP